jgi:hypothetical protein
MPAEWFGLHASRRAVKSLIRKNFINEIINKAAGSSMEELFARQIQCFVSCLHNKHLESGGTLRPWTGFNDIANVGCRRAVP